MNLLTNKSFISVSLVYVEGIFIAKAESESITNLVILFFLTYSINSLTVFSFISLTGMLLIKPFFHSLVFLNPIRIF